MPGVRLVGRAVLARRLPRRVTRNPAPRGGVWQEMSGPRHVEQVIAPNLARPVQAEGGREHKIGADARNAGGC